MIHKSANCRPQPGRRVLVNLDFTIYILWLKLEVHINIDSLISSHGKVSKCSVASETSLLTTLQKVWLCIEHILSRLTWCGPSSALQGLLSTFFQPDPSCPLVPECFWLKGVASKRWKERRRRCWIRPPAGHQGGHPFQSLLASQLLLTTLPPCSPSSQGVRTTCSGWS